MVVGEGKMAVFDDTKPWEDKLLLYPHQINWKNNLPVPTKADPEKVDIAQEEPLRRECRHFLDCITNGTQPITDGHEGLKVLKILNASQASLNDNGRIIALGVNSDKSQVTSPLGSSSFDSSLVTRYSQTDCFIHPTAAIDNNVKIGRGTKIWHFSHMLSN